MENPDFDKAEKDGSLKFPSVMTGPVDNTWKKEVNLSKLCSRIFLKLAEYYCGFLKESNPAHKLKGVKILENEMQPFMEKGK